MLTKLNFAQVGQLQKNIAPIALGRSEDVVVEVKDDRHQPCP